MNIKRTLLSCSAVIIITLPITVSAESATTADDRLNQAVSAQQLVLVPDTKAIVASRCVAAQAQISQTSSRTASIIKLDIDTYGSIKNDLLAIKLRLARQGVDGSEIDLLVGKMQELTDNLTISGSVYTGTLDDITSIDCINKPEEFMAGLVLARAQLVQVQSSANHLKELLSDSSTTTFSQIIKRLSS
jgi:hypothetical protein